MADIVRWRCKNCGHIAPRSELQGPPPSHPGSCAKKREDGKGYKAHEWERM